jgi:hypothetical protein
MSNVLGLSIIMILYFVIILAVVGLSVYVMILAINFLKKGTEAFNLYIDHQKKDDNNNG